MARTDTPGPGLTLPLRYWAWVEDRRCPDLPPPKRYPAPAVEWRVIIRPIKEP